MASQLNGWIIFNLYHGYVKPLYPHAHLEPLKRYSFHPHGSKTYTEEEISKN